MKIFNRASLPSKIVYNGSIYVFKILPQSKRGDKIVVKVLSSRLKDKTDLHGKPYQPSQWIFSKQLSNN